MSEQSLSIAFVRIEIISIVLFSFSLLSERVEMDFFSFPRSSDSFSELIGGREIFRGSSSRGERICSEG